MFTIRKATIDDRSLIHDLASRIWENTYGKILSKEQLDYMFDMMYAPDNILKQMEELHHQYFIILADDMPAGYLSIEKTGEKYYKVTTKKRNAERYSDRIELQGFQSCFRLFVKPSQSPLKPNQDAATLLVRNHARKGDKRTRIAKQGVKD